MGEEGEVDFQAQQEALEAEATDQSLDWAQEWMSADAMIDNFATDPILL